MGAVIIAAAGGSRAGMFPFDAYALGSFVPALAVTVRRLHDIGKSGWFVLLA